MSEHLRAASAGLESKDGSDGFEAAFARMASARLALLTETGGFRAVRASVASCSEGHFLRGGKIDASSALAFGAARQPWRGEIRLCLVADGLDASCGEALSGCIARSARHNVVLQTEANPFNADLFGTAGSFALAWLRLRDPNRAAEKLWLKVSKEAIAFDRKACELYRLDPIPDAARAEMERSVIEATGSLPRQDRPEVRIRPASL